MNTNQELTTEFNTALDELLSEFNGYMHAMSPRVHDSDTMLCDLGKMEDTFLLMIRDTQALYQRRAEFGAYWIEGLYGTFSEYAAELHAIIQEHKCYHPLRRSLWLADQCALTLLQWAYSIEAFIADVMVAA